MSQLDVTFITQVSDYNKVGSVFCKWDAIIAEECFPIVAQIQKKDCKCRNRVGSAQKTAPRTRGVDRGIVV
jgi:hypothetical protein